eukprot:793080-Pyramimonas_sp.AAC.1
MRPAWAPIQRAPTLCQGSYSDLIRALVDALGFMKHPDGLDATCYKLVYAPYEPYTDLKRTA